MIRSLTVFTVLMPFLANGCAAPSVTMKSGATAEATLEPKTLESLTIRPSSAFRIPHSALTPTGSKAYHGLIQYRAKDAKEAIVEPTLLPATKAMIAAGTKVIGVFVNGEARAYPLFILNNHQIVNDTVGGIPVSASW